MALHVDKLVCPQVYKLLLGRKEFMLILKRPRADHCKGAFEHHIEVGAGGISGEFRNSFKEAEFECEEQFLDSPLQRWDALGSASFLLWISSKVCLGLEPQCPIELSAI